jgi:GAF domain-containing protein
MRRLGQRTPLDCTEPFRREALALRGETARVGYLDEGGYTEQAGLAELVASNSRGAVYVLQTQRLYLRYLFRDLAAALEVADAGEPFADGAPATYHIVTFQQTLALVCLGLADSAPSAEARAALVARARANRALLAPLDAQAPRNHRHRLLLIDAELARVAGETLAAMDGYDAAIAAARENGFVQDEALANELAGRFYRAKNKPTAARAYLLEACSAWSRWGATAKVSQLEAELPDSIVRLGPGKEGSVSADATGGELDLETLSKATLAMSSEIKTDRLVERVLAVSVQNAGATRGLLLLFREGTLRLEASQGEGFSPRGTALAELVGAPTSILQYAARTGAKLALPDARTDARFASDEAISKERPLSVLAVPLTSRGQLSGLIYLENDLTPDAFSPARIQLQEMLGAQAVISLENARLYDEMELQVARRTQELSVVNEKLAVANADLEQRVQVKVGEALAAAEQMTRLNQRLQERVRDRSEELARALRHVATPEPKSPSGDLPEGTVLAGRVRILRPLGRGGMGAVYLGEDLGTHEQIAVKVIRGAAFSDEKAMQRFLRESRAAASVLHPAVARTLGVDVSDLGLIFQIQEYVDGESLERVLHACGRLSRDAVVQLAAPLARALCEAHANGVVHRDIKPSNIMVTGAEPGLKLLDFGIARLVAEPGEPGVTLSGQLVGTPEYMAPERFLSPDDTDRSIDVYALGVVLFELLTGRLPHRSRHLAGRAVLDPVSLSQLAPEIPAPLAELVMACLTRSPAERPSSAELARDLEELAERAGPTTLAVRSRGWVQAVREGRVESVVAAVDKPLFPTKDDSSDRSIKTVTMENRSPGRERPSP